MFEDNFDNYVDKASELKEKQLEMMKQQAINKSKIKIINEEKDKEINAILKDESIPKKKKIKKEIIKEEVIPVTEEIIKEEVIPIAEEKPIIIQPIIEKQNSKEDLILQKLSYIEMNMNNLIELLPEVINKSITDFNELQQKFAVLENNLLTRPVTPGTKSKRIVINRDTNGKIINADLIEGE